jgi:hypothetical protein
MDTEALFSNIRLCDLALWLQDLAEELKGTDHESFGVIFQGLADRLKDE